MYIVQGKETNYSFFEFYIHEKMDLGLTILVTMVACIVNIFELSRKTLTGTWTVLFLPKVHDKNVKIFKQVGTMILYEKGRRFYVGSLQLDFVDANGNVVVQGYYSITLKRKILSNKIEGESEMKIRYTKNDDFVKNSNDLNNPLIKKCDYTLNLDNANQINGIAKASKNSNAECSFKATRM
jgi:hypothetical protein